MIRDSIGAKGGVVSAKRTNTRLGAAGVIMVLTAVAGTSSLVAAERPASGGGSLVVWDFKSGDEAFAGYYTAAEEAFETDHDGVDVEFVAQPFDQYYTLIGTAIQSGEGPDLLMFNGGAQLRDRVDALVPLDDFLASDAAGDALDRLAGWEAFQADGVTYGVPLTIQGIPIYYNKALYAEAGLDPEAPPATWEELAAACEAIIAAEITCFAGGNREGIQMEFWLTAMAPGSLTSDEYDAWLAGDRDWTSDNVRRIFQTWADSTANGWFPEGLNSTTMFMDSFAPFQAGEAANVIGLMSDVAHWKDFGEFLGDDLGVLPPLAFEGGNDAPFLSAEGGIGYSVTAWSRQSRAGGGARRGDGRHRRDDDLLRAIGCHRLGHERGPVRPRQRGGDDADQRTRRRPSERAHGAHHRRPRRLACRRPAARRRRDDRRRCPRRDATGRRGGCSAGDDERLTISSTGRR